MDIRRRLGESGKTVVFTNGCFDIIHRGHVDYLTLAKNKGDILIVGINSDNSIRRIKGRKRPVIAENDRAAIIAALECVDYVVIFEEDTPDKLIKKLVPNILAKGEDWAEDEIVGANIVKEAGGAIARIPLTKGHGTSELIKRIMEKYGGDEFGQ